MRYALSVQTPPAAEPFTNAEAKLHLRVTTATEDALVARLIKAARLHFETVCNRALIAQTLDLYFDELCESTLYLPKAPVSSVSYFKYVGTDGVLTTLDPASYATDLVREPGRIQPGYLLAWPMVRKQMNAVQIRFIAGYADAASVPDDIKQCLLLLIGHLFENREATISGTIIQNLPSGLEMLLVPHRVWIP